MQVTIPAMVAGSPIPIPIPSAILSLPLILPPPLLLDGTSVGVLVSNVEVDVASSITIFGVVFGSSLSV
jgi:hypothetical protein